MSSNLDAVRAQLAAVLVAAGVDAVTLVRTEVAPFVFVGLPTGTGQNIGIGAWRCEYPITAVGIGPGDSDAAAWLLTQVELILRTLGLAVFRPTSWSTGPDGPDLPAYQLTYPRDVPNPDC